MRRRGFTITEMLWALILLSFVAALGTQVISRCYMATMGEQKVAAAEASRNSFVRQLREDVWAATSLKVNGGALVIGEARSEVAYSWEGRQAKRTAGAEVMVWEFPETVPSSPSRSDASNLRTLPSGPGEKFAVEGAAVRVYLGADDAIVMPAPKLMAGGAR